MKKFIITLLLLTCVSKIRGYYSTCEIEGTNTNYWYNFKMENPIDDTFRGEIASFKTKNIIRMTITKNSYMHATWENQTLRLFTAENFDNFEHETDNTKYGEIRISLRFDCTEDEYETMNVYQKVRDTNNHVPLLNKNRYDYHFDMAVPEGFKLTDLMPIRAYDPDLTNDAVHFSIEETELFKVAKEGKSDYRGKTHTTTMTVLKELMPPFKQEFTLVATDDGTPIKSTSAILTITVGKSQNETNGNVVHPPVFAKHLYFARYNSEHAFEMEEPIVIKYGTQSNSVVKQIGYEKYFKVTFGESEHKSIAIEKLTQLSNEIISTEDYITIEIEVENEGLSHIPGRTAVLIRLPKLIKDVGAKRLLREVSSDENSLQVHDGGAKKNEKVIENYYYSNNGHIIPLVLFVLTVVCIVFINIFVVIMFAKNKIMIL